MTDFRILAINPGGTSTKLALFENDTLLHSSTIEHPEDDLRFFTRTLDQLKYRLMGLGRCIDEWKLDIDSVDAFVARGGPLCALPAGVYSVDGDMVADIREGRIQTDHSSLLGGLMARKLAACRDKPAYIVDPVSVDELADVARLSGLAELPRRSLWHALNSRHVARLACLRHGLHYESTRLVIVHLGSGISVSAHRDGRCIDVNNANEMGPFSPQRAGSLPAGDLIRLCQKNDGDELGRRIIRNAGLSSHLGTADLREVLRRMDDGDEKADLVFRAMAYQVAKEIGAMHVACGKAALIVLTGGLAHSERFTSEIVSLVEMIAPVEVFAGEMEMEALAHGALQVLRKEIEPAIYKDSVRYDD